MRYFPIYVTLALVQPNATCKSVIPAWKIDILGAVILLALTLQCLPTPAEAGCVADFSDCTYSVVCHGAPSAASTPNCANTANVTFILLDFTRDVLSKPLFSTTNFDGRVRSIRARNNSWTSLDSNAFSYYSNIKHLDLSGNNIHHLRDSVFSALSAYFWELNISNNSIGEVTRTTFSSSKNLISINLSHNKIARLTGYVFQNLADLLRLNFSHNSILTLDETSFTNSKSSKLESIDFSYNKIERLRTDTFQYLNRLQYLGLSYNSIVTLDDNCFNGLVGLLKINLVGNSLSSFNVSLINLHSLISLDASYNRFRKLDSYELKRLTSLETFIFDHNSLISIDADLFQPFVRLKSIDLGYNRITGPISANTFKSNLNLSRVNFEHNNLSYIEENAFANTKIELFTFNGNNFSGEIHEFTLKGLDSLVGLYLANQSVTAIRSKAFSNMNNLSWLNLSANFILEIDSDGINLASSLQMIDLSHNKLETLNGTFSGLRKLEHLFLQNNNIKVISFNAFLNLSSLKILDISFNYISVLQPDLLPLKSLESLSLKKNFILGEVKRNVFSPAPHLTELDISGHSLTKINNGSFYNLELAKQINLSCNAIEKIEYDSFEGLKILESLDLSHNNLSELKFNKSGMNNLRYFFIKNNYIKVIYNDTFSVLPYLKYVDLASNNIARIPSNVFSACKLKSLNLADNTIDQFDDVFTDFTNISLLNLSTNHLKTINFTFYKSLTELDLSDNRLDSVTEKFFANLPRNLFRLNLSKNNIISLSPGIFVNSSSLMYLNVSHNGIPVLRYGTLRGLTGLNVLDISGNRLRDLDVDLLHECPHLRTLVVDYNSIESIDVLRLTRVVKELQKLSIGGNPMSCKEVVIHVKNESLNLEITSVNRVYHLDNVNGIECGRVEPTRSTTVGASGAQGDPNTTHAILGVVLLWCSIISLFLVVIFVAMYYFRRNLLAIYASGRYHQRVSLELNSS